MKYLFPQGFCSRAIYIHLGGSYNVKLDFYVLVFTLSDFFSFPMNHFFSSVPHGCDWNGSIELMTLILLAVPVRWQLFRWKMFALNLEKDFLQLFQLPGLHSKCPSVLFLHCFYTVVRYCRHFSNSLMSRMVVKTCQIHSSIIVSKWTKRWTQIIYQFFVKGAFDDFQLVVGCCCSHTLFLQPCPCPFFFFCLSTQGHFAEWNQF